MSLLPVDRVWTSVRAGQIEKPLIKLRQEPLIMVYRPTMLGVVASVLVVVCKRMQQLSTMLGPALHRGKNATHKT